jgi:putative hydroxymethylpyrimidine transport system ATP-binding protein
MVRETKKLSAPAVYLSNASLSYRQQPLFKNLNITFPSNKCVCLLGPSGVGKTTILRIIADLITTAKPNDFSAQVTTSDSLPLTNRIAYMAQQDLLMPWLTVLENVLIGYKLRGINIKKHPQIKRRALSLLEKVNLQEVAGCYPNVLSGGMRQRAALARTLMEDAPVVLMDEPFASLDAITRLRLQDLTAKLLVDRTILLVTHDPLEALRLADIIYVLKGLPVKLSKPIEPKGKIPRAPQDPSILKLEAELFKELIKAHEESK